MSAPALHTESTSRLGWLSGISTCVFLLAAVIIGAEVSGLIGMSGMALYVGTFCIAILALLAAIVVDVVIGMRGGEGARTAAISGLLLLLPATAAAFIYLSGAPLV